MYHHSKIITMFASFPPRTIHIIRCDGLFCDRLGVFCPNDIRLSDPHGLLSHDSSLFLAERGEGNLSLFFYIIIFYSCQEQWNFVIQGIIVLVQQRLPTKRVVNLLSPLPAILSPTLPLTASICTDAPFVTCALPIRTAIPSPGGSISPDVKRQQVLAPTRLSFSFWWRRTVSTAAMCQNVMSANGSAITHLGCHATLNSRSTIVTSHLCSHLHKLVNYYFIAQPAFRAGCAGIIHPKINSIMNRKEPICVKI